MLPAAWKIACKYLSFGFVLKMKARKVQNQKAREAPCLLVDRKNNK
jgi:hypothetical protein